MYERRGHEQRIAQLERDVTTLANLISKLVDKLDADLDDSDWRKLVVRVQAADGDDGGDFPP